MFNPQILIYYIHIMYKYFSLAKIVVPKKNFLWAKVFKNLFRFINKIKLNEVFYVHAPL